jgi:hypothetical protein
MNQELPPQTITQAMREAEAKASADLLRVAIRDHRLRRRHLQTLARLTYPGATNRLTLARELGTSPQGLARTMKELKHYGYLCAA